MSRTRILMFGWELPPHNSGGLGTACFGLARALASLGADVNFVLPRKVSVTINNVNIIFAGSRRYSKKQSHLSAHSTAQISALMNINAQTARKYLSSLFLEVGWYAKKARFITKKHNFDVIHAHDWLSFPAGAEASSISGKPFVAHVHATEFDRTGGQGINDLVYDIEREGMTKAHAIVAVSGRTKQTIVEKYGIAPERISVVHNGIDEDQLPQADQESLQKVFEQLKSFGTKIVLFAGRITIQKGPDYFVRVAKCVSDYMPNTIFIIAGSGDMERQIIEESARLGISDKIMFAGFLRDKELSMMYAAADLYVMPSVSEPFGITPLEAVLRGTPVLISKQSGVAEVLTHSLKADFWDIDEMSNKIICALKNPALAHTLLANAQNELDGLTWNKAARACLSIYSDLIKI